MGLTMHPLRHRLQWLLLLGLCLPAGGCAMLPPLIEHGYTVISGISYLATSKGPTDHALSAVTDQDCSLFRLLRGEPVCSPRTEDSNRPLLVTLREMIDAGPRDLPPDELLRQLPAPIKPGVSLDSTLVAGD